jgi:PKD repeat protein
MSDETVQIKHAPENHVFDVVVDGKHVAIGKEVLLFPEPLPVVDFTDEKMSLTVKFRSLSTISRGQLVVHRWDFGDGTPEIFEATGERIHTYSEAGEYDVRHSSQNEKGLWGDFRVRKILVEEEAPPVVLPPDTPDDPTVPLVPPPPNISEVFTCPIAPSMDVDQTAAINAWIASVPDGTPENPSVLYFPGTTYHRIDLSLQVVDKNNFTIYGGKFRTLIDRPGSLTARHIRTRAHFDILGGSNVMMFGVEVYGPNPIGGVDGVYDSTLEAQHGVNVRGTQGVSVMSCHFHHIWGDFVYFGGQSGVWSSAGVVADNVFHHNGRQGIAVVAGHNLLIDNNDIYEVRRSVFDVEPNTNNGGGENITIRNNRIGRKRLNWFASHGKSNKVGNILVENNFSTTAMNMDMKGRSDLPETDPQYRGSVIIRNNIADASYGTPRRAIMKFERYDGIYVYGNEHRVQRNRDMHGVSFRDCLNFEVYDNNWGEHATGEFFVIE